MTGGSANSASVLSVSAGFWSETGQRADNEDYAAWLGGTRNEQARRGVAAALADGVGGHKGGRAAAELTVRGFLDAYAAQEPLRGVRRNASTAIEAMNRWIHTIGSNDPSLEGMACTFTALVLRGRMAHVIHIGDSRLYRLRERALVRLTVDHVVDRPERRNVLTRAIGPSASAVIDYAAEPARVHDRYLLCSDGVHGRLHDKRIADLLGERGAPEEAARQIVRAALDAGSGDNATALVLDVLDLPPADLADLGPEMAAMPLLPPPRSGATVDGFRLDRMLADGRYSRVFRAVDRTNSRDVVIKFPKPVADAEAVLRSAFLREAWIATLIKSPVVGETIEVPPDRRSCLYTVMPFYDGETLEQRLSRRPRLSLQHGLSLAAKLARGVAALHRNGVIHRDIKPENVILTADGGLRLVDLGVARLPNVEDVASPHTPGTPSYMAPEFKDGSAGDELTDLFALGVTIFRAFTGAYPYGEVEVFSRPRYGQPASLLKHRPDLPSWLDAALARAFAVSRDERPADVFEFLFLLEHGALVARPAPPRRRSVYERNPLRFWQVVSAVLLFAVVILLARH